MKQLYYTLFIFSFLFYFIKLIFVHLGELTGGCEQRCFARYSDLCIQNK